jgi:hypothetical protein
MGTFPALLSALSDAATDVDDDGYFDNIYAQGGVLGYLSVHDAITLLDGGMIRTAEDGQRIEFTNTDKNKIRFYSGDDAEVFSGSLQESTNGSGVARTLQFYLLAPTVAADDAQPYIVLRSGSVDGSTSPPGIVFAEFGASGGLSSEISIQDNIPLVTSGVLRFSGLGSPTNPAIGIGSNFDDGIYSRVDGELNLTTSGVERMRLSNAGALAVTKPYGCDVYSTSTQTITDNLWTTLSMNAERYDPHADFSTSTNTWTCPATGMYSFGCMVRFSTAASTITDFRVGVLHSSGESYESWTDNVAFRPALSTSGARYVNAGETLKARVYQLSGASRSTRDDVTKFWVARIS